MKLLTTVFFVVITLGLQAQIFHYPFTSGNTDNQINNSFSTIIAQATSPVADPLGVSNNAMSFMGGSSELWVNSGDLIDFGLTTSFTFITSFYSVSSADQDIFRDLLANGNGWEIGIYDNVGNITFNAGEGSTSVQVRTADTYNEGEWHHLALLVDKTDLTIQIYIDGFPSELTATICGEELSGTEISIAGCNFNANEDNTSLTTIGENLLGGLDELFLYPELLEQQEIANLFSIGYINIPELATPSNNSNNLDPTSVELTWDNMSEANSYELEYDTDINFNDPILLTPTSNSATLMSLSSGEEYFWRVRVITDLGTSLNSNTWSFQTLAELEGSPSLVSPSNNSSDLPIIGVELNWNNLTNASSYLVEYDTNSDFNAPISQTIDDSQLDLPALTENTTYFWRVQGENVISQSEFSETWQFSTASSLEDAPNLVSPANGATDVPYEDLTLTWDELDGADSYLLQYSENNSFLSPIEVELGETSYTIPELDSQETFYWRVRAINSVSDSPFSDVWEFTTDVNLSIHEISLDFSIYPNPSLEQFTIESEHLISNVTIKDELGRIIKETASSLGQVHTEDISFLTSGVYYIQIVFTNGRVGIEKLIVQ